MGTKIFIECVVDTEDATEARRMAEGFIANPNTHDVVFHIATAVSGYRANASAYRKFVSLGADSRDAIEEASEKIARAAGWDRSDGHIYDASVNGSASEALLDLDAVTYDSWTDCCRQEGLQN